MIAFAAIIALAASTIVLVGAFGHRAPTPSGPTSDGAASNSPFSPNGRLLVLARFNFRVGYRLSIRETSTGQVVRALRQSQGFTSPVFGRGGTLVLAETEKEVGIWDARSGRRLHTLSPREGMTVWSAVFSADGTRVLTIADTHPPALAQIWDTESGSLVRTLDVDGGMGGILQSAAFSPDGTLVVTASIWGAQIWETATGRLRRTMTHSRGAVSAAFSPDGTLVIAVKDSTFGSTVELSETATGRPVRTLPNGVSDAAFSPDGKLIITTGLKTQIWAAKSGRLLHSLSWNGRGEAAGGALFSPNGKSVVTCGGAQIWKTRIWDVASGRLRVTLHQCDSVALSPNGALLLTTSHNGTARLWKTATGQLVRSIQG